MKNVQHLLDSPMPPEFLAGGKSPFLYVHSGGRSQYRIVSLRPSSYPKLWCCTKHFDLVGWHLILTSLRWFQTSSTRGGGICLNHSLKGVSSVTLIVCSVEWVQPNLVDSYKKMSWYSTKRQWAVSANSRGHEFNPFKSNSSNSLPCLCLIVKLGG